MIFNEMYNLYIFSPSHNCQKRERDDGRVVLSSHDDDNVNEDVDEKEEDEDEDGGVVESNERGGVDDGDGVEMITTLKIDNVEDHNKKEEEEEEHDVDVIDDDLDEEEDMMSDLSEIDEEISHLGLHLLQICHTHDVMISSSHDDDVENNENTSDGNVVLDVIYQNQRRALGIWVRE